MPWNALLLTCLLAGKTSFLETGTGTSISVKPESGETVLFFAIDDQSNPRCKLRQALGMHTSDEMCDLLVFYATETRLVLCLVELKRGRKIEKAVRQITNTYTYLKKGLSISSNHIEWKAYILVSRGSPQETKPAKELETYFGKHKYAIREDKDLSNFLRKK